MAGPSLLWLRDHEPDAYTSARWALQPKDWLRMRLTGEVGAEPSDASATLLYDLLADDWAYPAIEALGLRAELLAPLIPSAVVGGTLTGEAAGELGLGEGLPVAAGAADTAAAMLGAGLLRPGPVQLTVGTGGQIVTPKESPDPDPRLRTHLYRGAVPGLWYSMAAIQNAGLALEWVRKVLGVSWEEVYEEAFAVPPGAGGVAFLPYLSGERTPRFDPAPAAPGPALASTTPGATFFARPSKASRSRCARASKRSKTSESPPPSSASPGVELAGDPEARETSGGSYWPTCSAARCGCCEMRSPPSRRPVAPLFWPASPPESIRRPRIRSLSPPSRRDPYVPARRARTTGQPTNATRNSIPGSTVEYRRFARNCERSRYTARYSLLHYVLR